MSWDAQIWGTYSEYHGDFGWVNLDVACRMDGVRLDARHHRAAGDGRLSARMNDVAQTSQDPAA